VAIEMQEHSFLW